MKILIEYFLMSKEIVSTPENSVNTSCFVNTSTVHSKNCVCNVLMWNLKIRRYFTNQKL